MASKSLFTFTLRSTVFDLRIQGFVLAMQLLFHLSHAPALYTLVYFSDRIFLLLLLALEFELRTLCLLGRTLQLEPDQNLALLNKVTYLHFPHKVLEESGAYWSSCL
jgi:hypothetical protein